MVEILLNEGCMKGDLLPTIWNCTVQCTPTSCYLGHSKKLAHLQFILSLTFTFKIILYFLYFSSTFTLIIERLLSQNHIHSLTKESRLKS